MEKLKDLENNLIEINSLLEILKGYCNSQCEYSKEISYLIVILDIISRKHDEFTKIFENLILDTNLVFTYKTALN